MEKLLQRLGYKGEGDVLVLNAPQSFVQAAWPHFLKAPDTRIAGTYSLLLCFVTQRAQVEQVKADLVRAAARGSYLWFVYPKKTSKNYQSDLNRDLLWPLLGEEGYEPVSQYAVDEDWSAIRFRPVGEIKSMVRQRAATQEGAARAAEGRSRKEK